MKRALLLPLSAFAMVAGCAQGSNTPQEHTAAMDTLFANCSSHRAHFTALDPDKPTALFHVLINGTLGPTASLHVAYDDATGRQDVTLRSGRMTERERMCLRHTIAKSASLSF